jgi:hypothetical protein
LANEVVSSFFLLITTNNEQKRFFRIVNNENLLIMPSRAYGHCWMPIRDIKGEGDIINSYGSQPNRISNAIVIRFSVQEYEQFFCETTLREKKRILVLFTFRCAIARSVCDDV